MYVYQVRKDCEQKVLVMIMDKEKLTEYIKWLLSQLDEISSDDIDRGTVRTMLLSIIGEMYSR